METFSRAGGTPPTKIRPPGFYHNVPRSTLRGLGSEYAIPNCTGRRSVSSLAHHTHHSNLWQERPPRTPVSCIIEHKPSKRGRMCSIALAIASFIVLIVVLGIAGLALYMGISQTDSSNTGLLTFSCSVKVMRGDRFVTGLQEQAMKYKRQFDSLYQRSILGPAFISSSIERFGRDGFTIYFKLAFNGRKLSANISNIERAVKEILFTDALSKKPVFRNIRFDPRSMSIKQISYESETNFASSAQHTVPSTKPIVKNKSVIQKPQVSNVHHNAPKKPIDEPVINEEDLPVIQGSFKISKTDADITEKKTETTTMRSTTQPTRKTTFKESSVTSALYKIAAVEKVSKDRAIPSTTTATASTTKFITPPKTTTTQATVATSVKNVFTPQIYDDEPWIPIISDITGSTDKPAMQNVQSFSNNYNNHRPIYTSFTNPGLSYHFRDVQHLGSTSLKGHPIPVNKIPVTEPFSTEPVKVTTDFSKTGYAGEEKTTSFVEMDTVKYVPQKNIALKKEQLLKNISSIFQTLAESLDEPKVPSGIFEEDRNEGISGQGQVEVVEDEMFLQTTKVPLVTLLPVRSNSGVGRPFRRPKPSDNNISVENRSFPNDDPTKINLNLTPSKDKTKSGPENIQIMGVLNFATEGYDYGTAESARDLMRLPKMEADKSEIVVYATNSSVSAISQHGSGKNILSPEKIKELAEISNVSGNGTTYEDEPIISTKAISSSYSINHSGFKVLTKTFNKIGDYDKSAVGKLGLAAQHNVSDCEKFSFKCGDGKCLPETTKCNQLIDCSDGKDEQNCNCIDYLKSQYLINKICDGVVDCWDFSDENQCEWCTPNQYVCSNSKMCIDQIKICDGFKDCPQGDDERQCVTIASNAKTAQEFPYFSEGFLMVRKDGTWGKLCIDNLKNVSNDSNTSYELEDLGKAICKSMTYQVMNSITTTKEIESPSNYFELSFAQNQSKPTLSFTETSCDSRKVVKVKCKSLECGARPQAVKHIARVVGGGNAGIGAWPWQAALYKEGEFQCGATLLSDRWLVSAGHCFYHSQEEHWVARLGALRRGTTLPSPYEQLRTIVKILVHPGYLDFGFINDISLLQMEQGVTFSDYVRPVCLPQPGEEPGDGGLCTVVGWGQLFEVGRIFPDTLQEVQVPVISTAECRKKTLFLPLYKITDDMFCAGYERGGRDACLGDSGGPLMCPESNGRWTLHGITSNGYGCARANRPGVYTKVANYVEWIFATMEREDKGENSTKPIKTSCVGHRCPLGECLPESRLCNGFIECSDASDEKNC